MLLKKSDIAGVSTAFFSNSAWDSLCWDGIVKHWVIIKLKCPEGGECQNIKYHLAQIRYVYNNTFNQPYYACIITGLGA